MVPTFCTVPSNEVEQTLTHRFDLCTAVRLNAPVCYNLINVVHDNNLNNNHMDDNKYNGKLKLLFICLKSTLISSLLNSSNSVVLLIFSQTLSNCSFVIEGVINSIELL